MTLKSTPQEESQQGRPKKRSIPMLLGWKEDGRKIVALTCYDALFAALLDQHGEVDLLLVGDSLATVVQGHQTTLPVTLEEIIYHTKCAARGVQHAVLVADLPFMSYQVSVEQAIENAGRLVKEGGAHAVKLEGGETMRETISRLVSVDIPVVGHIGLTPQSYHRMGGHKIQGRARQGALRDSAEQVLRDAQAVAEAGAFALVLEGIPAELAAEIQGTIDIPTIGIGAGPHCDGQVLVTHDMLGFQSEFCPRFLKKYRQLGVEIQDAVREYAEEVREGAFPTQEHSFYEQDGGEMRQAAEGR
ncbi:3-methyl-2-oxobutanoate hydroxymethyltransferase [bacterium]|nr:3-methyl-2-oxobutanoate hydroxymethyltransferase [bacterium]